MNEKNRALGQKIVETVAGIIAVVGIYFVMASQIDMSDNFAIGVYLCVCVGVIWALRRFVHGSIR